MPYNLKGRNVLVTGGSRGLGALICERFAEEGCNIAITYLSKEHRAKEVADKCKKHNVKTIILQADAGITEDNSRILQTTVKELGGLDIIVANAGWTKFTKFGDLSAMSDAEWNKCWATNVMSHLQLVREVLPIFNNNPDGGVYLISSSVAGLAPAGSSMPYSVTKAAGLHLMKSLATSQGPKLRINAICPGLLLTEWGLQFTEQQIEDVKERAALKQETKLDDCAEMYVSAAKNTSMTGQQIVVDSGLVIK